MIALGRPPQPVGTFGRVHFVELPNGDVEARARFRDLDGQARLVSKRRMSRAAAERALMQEFAARSAAPGAAITGATRLDVLADAWLDAPHGWSTGTERTYRTVVRNQVKPAVGQLCVREVTPGVVSRALASIGKASGAGAAKTARACLSGMFTLAVSDGAVAANPVREAVSPSPAIRRKSPRALTLEETTALVALFRSSERAAELDVPDLVDWMLATGARIGEALALRHGRNADGKQLLDLEAGTWEVNATVVRIPKEGLHIQPRPKTAAGWRVVAVPEFAIEMVRRRSTDGEVVFASQYIGGPRDRTTFPETYANPSTASTASTAPVLARS